MEFMLDTNICIYLIKKKPGKLLEKIQSLSVGEAALSSITLSELEYGVAKSTEPERNRRALEAFIAPLDVMPFDEQAAYHYGRTRAFLEKKGTPVGAMDMLIGAHALSLSLTIVTNNVREFQRIPDLRVENWV